MRRSYQLLCLLTLSALSACGPQKSGEEHESHLNVGGRQVGGFKGLSEIEIILSDRLSNRSATRVISPTPSTYDFGSDLAALLGAFTENATRSQFEAAAPNPVNALLWGILMDSTAQRIADLVMTNPQSLDQEFAQGMIELQTVGLAEDGSSKLRDIWQVLMRYDAPESEREAWLMAMQQPDTDWRTSKGTARVQAVLLTLLMHPYFLIEH